MLGFVCVNEWIIIATAPLVEQIIYAIFNDLRIFIKINWPTVFLIHAYFIACISSLNQRHNALITVVLKVLKSDRIIPPILSFSLKWYCLFQVFYISIQMQAAVSY